MYSNTDIPAEVIQSELPDLVTGLRISEHPAIVWVRRETVVGGFADQTRFPLCLDGVFLVTTNGQSCAANAIYAASGSILFAWNAGSWVLAFARAGRGVTIDLIMSRRTAIQENIATRLKSGLSNHWQRLSMPNNSKSSSSASDLHSVNFKRGSRRRKPKGRRSRARQKSSIQY